MTAPDPLRRRVSRAKSTVVAGSALHTAMLRERAKAARNNAANYEKCAAVDRQRADTLEHYADLVEAGATLPPIDWAYPGAVLIALVHSCWTSMQALGGLKA